MTLVYVLSYPRVDTSRCRYPTDEPVATKPYSHRENDTRRKRELRQEARRLGYTGKVDNITTRLVRELRAAKGIDA